MYQPGKWVPHCTLAMDMDISQLEKAISICADVQLPIEMKADEIGAVEFLPVSDYSKYNLKV
jgi:2'-5' RNA ligase